MRHVDASTWWYGGRRTAVAATAALGLLAATVVMTAESAAAAPVATRRTGAHGHGDPNVTAPVPNHDADRSAGPANTLVPFGAMRPAAASAPPAATGTPRTYRVYATREGLTGHTTANGHKVVANDHFVSLPSGSSLSAKGKNYYSVRVCSTANKRCAYEPVWDVGPWNTGDSYWNLKRTSWTKLPSGTPEA